MSKTIKDENQMGFEFETPNWINEIQTFTTDGFLGQIDSADDKRIVAFDFMNDKVYVIPEETIENNQLNQKSAKDAFNGLVVLSQTAKETPGFGVEENATLLERAENAYRTQLFKSLNKEDIGKKADELVNEIKEEEKSGINYDYDDLLETQTSSKKEQPEPKTKKRNRPNMQ